MAEGIDLLGLNRPAIDYGTCSFTAMLNEAQQEQVKTLPCLLIDVAQNSVTNKNRGALNDIETSELEDKLKRKQKELQDAFDNKVPHIIRSRLNQEVELLQKELDRRTAH